MLRFGEAKVAKKTFMVQEKIKIWEADVDNILISKLIETKNSSKYLTRYLDEVIRQLVLILPKLSGDVKRFKDKDGDKNKNKKNKLMSFI